MKLIVGLGNTGPAYTANRHNLGFMVVNKLAEDLSTPKWSTSTKFLADTCEVGTGDNKIILAKPTTMMNLSGHSVVSFVHYYKLSLDDVWVVHDELDLDFGLLRLRQGGGSAGNNGIASIIEAIGADFWRFRLGINNEYLATTDSARFVLDDFNQAESTQLAPLINKASAQIARCLEDPAQLSHSDISLI